MVFDRSGSKKSHKFMRAMMRSHAGISYEEAQAAFDGNPGAACEPLMKTALEPLWAAYQALCKARDKRQPLDLDLPERRVRLDDDGRVAGIDIPERLEAHRLIEEFMIQANVSAAESLEESHAPIVYRAHEKPSREKLKGLSDFLETLDLRLPKAANLKPQHFNTILKQAKLLPVPDLVNEVILRAQAQAEYATENAGHFGLNLRRYAHFTSPIRRYADLLVHRSLIDGYGLGEGALSDTEAQQFDEIGEHISATERRAVVAERDAMDRYTTAFMAERVGATFTARISGVTRFGLFVTLDETGADGLIPVSTLAADFFIHDEVNHALVGERTGTTFTLADPLVVELVEADTVTGGMVFTVVEGGKEGRPARKAGPRRTGARRAPASRKVTPKSNKGKPRRRRG
jgi:ribonuclease R